MKNIGISPILLYYKGKVTKMKTLLTAILAGTAAFVMAAENVIAPAQPADLKKINGTGTLTVNSEQIFELNGVANFLSTKVLTIDPKKTYKLSGEFRAKDGTKPAKLYFGFAPLNARKTWVVSEQIQGMKGTETVLTADAKPGDTVLKIKDGSKWRYNSGLVAFNAKADMSDIPNANLSPAFNAVVKDGDGYIVKLVKPLKKGYAKGTMIRQHRSAGTYQYAAAASAPLSHKWKTFSAVISGEAPRETAITNKKWWYTTRNIRILILGNYAGNKGSVMQFKNIKLEELTR